jgi:hypothetical protein
VATEPHVAFSGSRAIAVWRRNDGKHDIVQGANRPPATGVWGAPVNLSEGGQDAESPSLAVNSKGYALAAWDRSNGTNKIVQASVRTPGTKGVWRATVNLSAEGQDALHPSVALNKLGEGMAVWERWNESSEIVQASALVPPL